MLPNMRVMLKMVTNMGEESRFSPMETDMRDYMLMASQKVMEFIAGKMEQYIKDSLKMGLDMGMVLGRMEVRLMKEIILMIREMDKEYTNGEVGVIIGANLWMICGMGLVKCTGIKIRITRANGGKVYSGDKDKSGKTTN